MQGILLKIIKSQNEDTKLAIEQLTDSIQDLNNLKLQLELCKSLSDKQAEEINYLNHYKKGLKRARFASILIISAGVSLGLVGGTIKQYDDIKPFGDILLFGGIGLTLGGAIPLGLSITIPF